MEQGTPPDRSPARAAGESGLRGRKTLPVPAVTDDPAALLERALAILAEDSAAWQERRPAPSASEAAAEAPQAVDRPARGGSGS